MQNSHLLAEQALFCKVFNAHFDRIYVLTIPSTPERQQSFADEMAGLNYQFFYGTDRNALNLPDIIAKGIYDDVNAKKIQRRGKGMTLSEIACSWGHRNIYQDMVDHNIKSAFIFEDDAFILRENMQFLPAMMDNLPPDWQIFYFDYNKNEKKVPLKRSLYHIQHSLGFLSWNHTIIRNLFPRPVNKFWKTSGFHDYTNAYAVKLEAAQKLIGLQTPICMTADNLLANSITKEHLVGYVAVPKLFGQKSAGDSPAMTSLVEKSV